MRLLAFHGIVCDVGVLGKRYVLTGFDPIKDSPNGVYLGSFYSNYPTEEATRRVFTDIRGYSLVQMLAKVFKLDEIAQAHRRIENNRANRKTIVVT